MEPIGLTTKKDGEIMLVHRCLSCGKISCNRIAGDDNSYTIISLLENSSRLPYLSINLLTEDDKEQVQITLFGYSSEI